MDYYAIKEMSDSVNKKVSVIMPAYNAEKWIKNAVQSVLLQSYSNFELIIVNDGSEDGTKEICESFIRNDQRIKLFSQKNSGLCAARNQGLQLASGDYFIIIDSDDVLEPKALESLVFTAEIKEADIVIAGYWSVRKNDENKTLRSTGYDFDFEPKGSVNSREVEELIKANIIAPTWNKLYKILYASERFDTKLAINEDVLFSLKAIKKAARVSVIAEPTYNYIIQNNNSLSSRFHPEFPDSLDKIIETISENEKPRDEIIAWLLDSWFVYVKQICRNTTLSRQEKIGYLRIAQAALIFRYYGHFQYCITNKRKITLLLMKFRLNSFCIRYLERKAKK